MRLERTSLQSQRSQLLHPAQPTQSLIPLPYASPTTAICARLALMGCHPLAVYLALDPPRLCGGRCLLSRLRRHRGRVTGHGKPMHLAPDSGCGCAFSTSSTTLPTGWLSVVCGDRQLTELGGQFNLRNRRAMSRFKLKEKGSTGMWSSTIHRYIRTASQLWI